MDESDNQRRERILHSQLNAGASQMYELAKYIQEIVPECPIEDLVIILINLKRKENPLGEQVEKSLRELLLISKLTLADEISSAKELLYRQVDEFIKLEERREFEASQQQAIMRSSMEIGIRTKNSAKSLFEMVDSRVLIDTNTATRLFDDERKILFYLEKTFRVRLIKKGWFFKRYHAWDNPKRAEVVRKQIENCSDEFIYSFLMSEHWSHYDRENASLTEYNDVAY